MKSRIAALTLALATTVSACSSIEPVTRAEPLTGVTAPDLGVAASRQDWSLAELRVVVPETLRVSEANSYMPNADIVWRDDPYGDRRQQVATVIHEAMAAPLARLDGSRRVVVDIEVTRFHALTERARYTVGGRHAIRFSLSVRDAETGEILSGPREVDASFGALGGQAAIASEAQGIGQRERIQAHLDLWVREEFGLAPTDALVTGVR